MYLSVAHRNESYMQTLRHYNKNMHYNVSLQHRNISTQLVKSSPTLGNHFLDWTHDHLHYFTLTYYCHILTFPNFCTLNQAVDMQSK